MERNYYVYIMANRINTVLYTGVTGDLPGRVYEHREGLVEGFTKRYHVHKLVYYEVCGDVMGAIEREKKIKGGSRKKKMELIDAFNPKWRDLYEEL